MKVARLSALLVPIWLLVAAAVPAGSADADPRFDPALTFRIRAVETGTTGSAFPDAKLRGGVSAFDGGASSRIGSAVPLVEGNPDRPIPALLSFPALLEAPDLSGMGFTVVGKTGSAAAVLGSPASFERLSRWPGLGAARLSRPVKPTLDRSLEMIRGTRIRHGVPPEYIGPTGKGALVAIIDTGVDILHRDFRRPDGSSRVVAYWDQSASGVSSEVPAGQVYREAEMREYISGRWTHPRGWDRVGHGTHVAGIAAGNGSAAGAGQSYRYVGVAPEADLIVVNTGFDEVSVISALFFVMDEADRRGRPVAVNLSLGNQYGPHDGTDPFERIISDLCGPGRQVVVAGGNQGNDRIHAFLAAGQGADSVSVFLPPYAIQGDLLHVLHLEGWTALSASFSATIVQPGGRRIGPIRGGPHEFSATSHVVRSGTGRTDTGSYFFIEAFFYGAPRVSGEWTIVIEPDPETARAPIHFWIPLADFNGGGTPYFLRGQDPRATLSPPANARNVIAVSALVSRTCWPRSGGESCFVTDQNVGDLAVFSSVGPTADGRPKPEVAAPGFGVMSALSASMTAQIRDLLDIPAYLDPDGVHWLNSGTSMSAPFVTGALALIMARIPDLTPEEARARFRLGIPVATTDGTVAGHRLDLDSFAMPVAQNGLFDAVLRDDGRVALSWYPIALQGSPLYRISRTLDNGQPEIVPGADRRGRGLHTFVDRPLEPGRSATYRLLAVDSVGVDETLGTVSVDNGGVPRLTLRTPVANPASPPLRLSFFVPASDTPTPYRLLLFDVMGRPVRLLASGVAGSSPVESGVDWDGRADTGRVAAAGVYVARLTSGSESRIVKVVLSR